ncbi:hypothetical protein Y1Q_0015909 [Alligator mississippiensis]|uniref:Uncharacterized protein n=1 Tax=Alligator mississippiensis TaxID=8496 RepID=A0A151MHE0_ALLMI|nr:hypothetical protein Y1Q_0015909 [Alligator mississippiensis]
MQMVSYLKGQSETQTLHCTHGAIDGEPRLDCYMDLLHSPCCRRSLSYPRTETSSLHLKLRIEMICSKDDPGWCSERGCCCLWDVSFICCRR